MVQVYGTAEERLWARTDRPSPYSCWEWQGHHNHGYGSIRCDGGFVKTHRLAYELIIGPIPQGLQLDHLCRNTLCCNPLHLEPVTDKENKHRGKQSQKKGYTTCPVGHTYDEVNTYLTPKGVRVCRRCQAAHARDYRKRNANA